MSNKSVWKNAAKPPKPVARPTEDELRNALRIIRNWRLYVNNRKQALVQSGEGASPDLMELEDRLNGAETDASEALSLIANFDDL